ncbi:hypothetical protein HMN09_00307800 [Mycena chlorophos]|uniref:Uncharacterized protein n=1 Tax=Mycena chlorophos TaxID=658473 RepID=A0A8H6TJU1_MYCCL|nr:hypothetical protein HMN09_00307800 [Mycena chlorophos]
MPILHRLQEKALAAQQADDTASSGTASTKEPTPPVVDPQSSNELEIFAGHTRIVPSSALLEQQRRKRARSLTRESGWPPTPDPSQWDEDDGESEQEQSLPSGPDFRRSRRSSDPGRGWQLLRPADAGGWSAFGSATVLYPTAQQSAYPQHQRYRYGVTLQPQWSADSQYLQTQYLPPEQLSPQYPEQGYYGVEYVQDAPMEVQSTWMEYQGGRFYNR